MPSVFKRGFISLFIPALLLFITACPGVIIDNITIYFENGIAVVGATGTFTCISPITGDVVGYQWSFGDGSTATGQTVSHAYSTPGTFLVECSVLTSTTVLTFTKQIQISVAERIAYECIDSLTATFSEVCVIYASGVGQLNISTTFGATGNDGDPRWSPDGTQIVYECDLGVDEDICIANADGTGTRTNLSKTIGGDSLQEENPRWSPDGTRIVYECDDTGNKICILNADGSGSIFNLSDSGIGYGGNDGDPRWSPDSTQIVYTCVSGGFKICVANADGTGTRLVLSDAWGGQTGTDANPTFSPDGLQVVYECLIAGAPAHFNICIGASDGSGSRFDLSAAVGHPALEDEQVPTWSPDGTRIGYVCGGFLKTCVANADGSGTRIVISDVIGGYAAVMGRQRGLPIAL